MTDRQPPYNNNNTNDQFEAELEAIENAMNSMMQGAFSSMFKQFMGSDNSIVGDIFSGVFGNDGTTTTTTTTTTTVLDGRNVSIVSTNSVDNNDIYGGNDFKRLANKSKQRRTGESSNEEQTVIDNDRSSELTPRRNLRQLPANENFANTTATATPDLNSIFSLIRSMFDRPN